MSDQKNLVSARFHLHPTSGRPVVTLKIGQEANAPDVTEYVTDKHMHEYPKEWFRFQNSRASVRPVGTPLAPGLGLDEDLASLFIAHGVLDVETFATLDDWRIQQIMPGNPILGIEHRNRALRMVPEAQRTPVGGPLPIKPVAVAAAVAAVAAPPKGELSEADVLRAQLVVAQQERDAAVRAYMEAATPAAPVDTGEAPPEPVDADADGAPGRRRRTA